MEVGILLLFHLNPQAPHYNNESFDKKGTMFMLRETTQYLGCSLEVKLCTPSQPHPHNTEHAHNFIDWYLALVQTLVQHSATNCKPVGASEMSLTAVILLLGSLSATPALSLEVYRPGPPDTCLAGPFHKDVPSPESEEFDECLSWQSKACCNVEVPRTIDRHKAVGLYNYSWDLCGTLSQECETFIKVKVM